MSARGCSADKPGIGLPERFVDKDRLRLDFLPFIERTVQEYGVLWDHVHYYSDILRNRIHERDPKNTSAARRFRRDCVNCSGYGRFLRGNRRRLTSHSNTSWRAIQGFTFTL